MLSPSGRRRMISDGNMDQQKARKCSRGGDYVVKYIRPFPYCLNLCKRWKWVTRNYEHFMPVYSVIYVKWTTL